MRCPSTALRLAALKDAKRQKGSESDHVQASGSTGLRLGKAAKRGKQRECKLIGTASLRFASLAGASGQHRGIRRVPSVLPLCSLCVTVAFPLWSRCIPAVFPLCSRCVEEKRASEKRVLFFLSVLVP